jgi:hypothetical protein
VTLRRPSQSRWWDRLWWEVGLLHLALAPAPVETGAPRSVRLVADGFALLVAIRAMREPGELGVPFTAPFASAWCGVATETAREAIAELGERDVIRRVGRAGRMNLYALGDGSRARRTSAAAGEGARVGA